jgi:hypothetical protein
MNWLFCYNGNMKPEFLGLLPQYLLALELFITEMNNRSMVFSRSKTKDVIYTMTHPSHKKTIAKLSLNKQGQLLIWLRFSASCDYSPYFSQKLIETLEEDDYRYVGCYEGCHECDSPRGYHVRSPKGCFFRCYKELILVGPIDQVPMDEVLVLIETQNQFETQKITFTR